MLARTALVTGKAFEALMRSIPPIFVGIHPSLPFSPKYLVQV